MALTTNVLFMMKSFRQTQKNMQISYREVSVPVPSSDAALWTVDANSQQYCMDVGPGFY